MAFKGCYVCQTAADSRHFNVQFPASAFHFLLTFPRRDNNKGKNDKQKNNRKKRLSKEVKYGDGGWKDK